MNEQIASGASAIIPVLLIILAAIIGVYAAVHLFQHDAHNKGLWFLAIVFSPISGGLIYLAIHKNNHR